MKIVILSLIMSCGLSSFADGFITIKGKVITCDSFFCQVKTKKQIYKIDLKKNSTDQRAELRYKKPGDDFNAAIVMSSVVSVTDVK